MQTNVVLPQVELTMDQVVVAKWLVKVGEPVEAEQPLVEVETQKAVTPVPAPCAGYVRILLVKEGESIGEKALLCVLTDTADETFGTPTESVDADSRQVSPATEIAAPSQAENSGGPVKATPAARRVAKELGVALLAVTGTGAGGRITEEDVRAAGAASTSELGDETGEWKPLPVARLALIAQMQKSLAEIPQIHLSRRLDVTRLAARIEGKTFTHRLIAAVAKALEAHASLRSIILNEKIKVEPVSVAVAIDTPHGLVAPVLRRPDQMPLAEISDTLNEFRRRAQSNSLQRHELINAPFAVTNLGMFDIDFFNAFVFHGQTAVLSVGRMTTANDGTSTAWFGLAADHRVVDGAEGARFLQTLQAEIQKA